MGVRGTMRARIAVGALAALLSFGAAPDDGAFERALSLATEKRYAEAREALDAMLERDSGHAQGRVLHGVLRAREGRIGEAIDIFEALQREHPEMAEPYNNLAVLYALEDRLEEARETLLAVLERRPDAVAYANLGDVYTKLARSAYERAQELDAGTGRGGTLETDTATAASSPVHEPPGTAPGGGEPAQAPPQTEPGVAVAMPTPPDAIPKPPEVTGTGRSPAAFGARDPAAVEMVPAGAEAAAPAVFCVRVGGFAGRRAVAEAALWLQSHGAQVRGIRREERRDAGPWRVYLPPFASRAEADAKLRDIRSRGVRDVAVIGDGELANGISFGVYAEATNMHRRMAAIERLGFAVQSHAAGGVPVEGYELEANAPRAAAAFESAWASRFPERPLQVVDCG